MWIIPRAKDKRWFRGLQQKILDAAALQNTATHAVLI
jgi:hypothetical protein